MPPLNTLDIGLGGEPFKLGMTAPFVGGAVATQSSVQVPVQAPTQLTTPLPAPIQAPPSVQQSIQQPIDQKQQLDQMLVTLKGMQSQLPTITPPEPQIAPQAQAIEPEVITPPSQFQSPVASFAEIYKKTYQDLGIPDIRARYNEVATKYTDLQTEKDEELESVMSDPWISQGTRDFQTRKIQDKYDRKTEILTNQLKLYSDVYENARQEAQFVTQQAVNAYYKERDFNQQLYLDAIKRAEEAAEAGTKILSVSEAKELGVPYGTTAAEAYGIKPREKETAGLPTGLDVASPTYIPDLLQSTVGRKPPTQVETLRPIQKSIAVVNQLEGLQETLQNTNTDPVLGYLKGLNPYDFDARAVQAQLQSIVPNLARGVYGEVGVLTDQDIRNYIQTLPNLKSTKEQNDFVTAMTLKTVVRNFESQLETLASAGYDVSGFKNQYSKMKSTVEGMEKKLGVGGARTVSGDEEAIYNEVIPTETGGGYISNLFKALIGQ